MPLFGVNFYTGTVKLDFKVFVLTLLAETRFLSEFCSLEPGADF